LGEGGGSDCERFQWLAFVYPIKIDVECAEVYCGGGGGSEEIVEGELFLEGLGCAFQFVVR
jgi:hypothetical protein